MADFQIIGILGKLDNKKVLPTLRALQRFLSRRGCEILTEAPVAKSLPGRKLKVVARRALARHCDLVIVVGGDGTLLSAGRTLAPAGVPLLGINQGRLGFMVDVPPAELEARLDRVLDGHFVRDRRLVLAAEIRQGHRSRRAIAINDIVIRNQAAVRMLEFETRLDGEFISRHRADGFIVSSPTGSTAYALSGGGPVMHPALDALALVPICPHTLSDRPVVVGADRKVSVILRGENDVRAMCTADGQSKVTLTPGDTVTITRDRHMLELIHPENYSYFNILRDKLRWGRAQESVPR